MDSENLYRVQREDLPKLEKLLNLCFAHDPLYETLIPNAEIRKKLMPELFHCDMDEFYETCEIFSDSEELNGVLVVSDETKSCNIFRFLYTEAKAVLYTDSFLIKEDPSLHTFYNFIKGGDYLNSNWTDQLHQNRRLHVIYLAAPFQIFFFHCFLFTSFQFLITGESRESPSQLPLHCVKLLRLLQSVCRLHRPPWLSHPTFGVLRD